MVDENSSCHFLTEQQPKMQTNTMDLFYSNLLVTKLWNIHK